MANSVSPAYMTYGCTAGGAEDILGTAMLLPSTVALMAFFQVSSALVSPRGTPTMSLAPVEVTSGSRPRPSLVFLLVETDLMMETKLPW